MSKHIISFSECEHYGDLDNYKDDLRYSGAIVLSSQINHDAEEGSVEVEIKDKKEFISKFKQTNSYGFSNLCQY
jgi:hypothetical protein